MFHLRTDLILESLEVFQDQTHLQIKMSQVQTKLLIILKVATFITQFLKNQANHKFKQTDQKEIIQKFNI